MTTAIVVFDPWYGCTQAAAEEVARGLSEDGRVPTVVASIASVGPGQVLAHEIIVIGSPSRRGAPTSRVRRLLEQLREVDLRGRMFAFFETCFVPDHGKAIRRMEAVLRDGNLLVSRQFLSVSVTADRPRGPVGPGELSKCRELGRSIRARLELYA
jgi:flavorubredoxin